VNGKYEGIFSKARVTQKQEKKIEDSIIYENKTDEIGVQSDGKPLNVKPYRHAHYQEIFQGIKEDQYHPYQQRRWNIKKHSQNMVYHNHYSIIYYQRPKNNTKFISCNYNTWNQRKQNYAKTNHQVSR